MITETEIAVETATETQIAENQISFDFLSMQKEEEHTPEFLTAENHDWVAEETLVVLIRASNEISPDFDILGKKLIDWVGMATSGCKQKIIEEPKEEDFLNVIKNISEGFSFVAVFYSDTPLLKKSTFLEIMDYFSKNRMNVLKLRRGFIFRGEFLANARMLLSSQVEEFGQEDFIIVNNAKTVCFAFDILHKRILDYHKERGVVFLGDKTTFVDADVEIESGAVIFPNNILKGLTYVGHNAILESGNYCIDSIICEQAFVLQSYLENAKIEKGLTVGPFEKIVGQKV